MPNHSCNISAVPFLFSHARISCIIPRSVWASWRSRVWVLMMLMLLVAAAKWNKVELNDLRCHSVHRSSSRDVSVEKVRHTCICLCLRVPMRWAMTSWVSVHMCERRLLESTMDVLSLCRGALRAVRSMLPHTATQITITKYTFSSLSDS